MWCCGIHGSMGASKPQQGICHERINGRDTIWRGVWSIPHTGKIQVNLWEKDWKILIWDGDISWRSWIKYCWASLAKISGFFYTQYKLRSNKFYLCFWWWLTWFIFHSPSHLFSKRSSAAHLRFLLLTPLCIDSRGWYKAKVGISSCPSGIRLGALGYIETFLLSAKQTYIS